MVEFFIRIQNMISHPMNFIRIPYHILSDFCVTVTNYLNVNSIQFQVFVTYIYSIEQKKKKCCMFVIESIACRFICARIFYYQVRLNLDLFRVSHKFRIILYTVSVGFTNFYNFFFNLVLDKNSRIQLNKKRIQLTFISFCASKNKNKGKKTVRKKGSNICAFNMEN